MQIGTNQSNGNIAREDGSKEEDKNLIKKEQILKSFDNTQDSHDEKEFQDYTKNLGSETQTIDNGLIASEKYSKDEKFHNKVLIESSRSTAKPTIVRKDSKIQVDLVKHQKSQEAVFVRNLHNSNTTLNLQNIEALRNEKNTETNNCTRENLKQRANPQNIFQTKSSIKGN